MSEWKRRKLDHAEERCIELETSLLNHMNKYGTANFQLTMNLSRAYVRRARERKERDCATREDHEILKEYK